MFKRLAWLFTAMLAFSGGVASAAQAEPDSMDRHLAPNEYPTHVVKILRTTNKAQTNSYVPVVFTMRNNNPFNVIRQLRRPIEQEEGLLFTFVSPEGQGGKVLFVVPQYMVQSLGELVHSVDLPGLTTSSGTYRNYIALKHRRASLTDPSFIETVASFSTGNDSTLLTDPEANSLYWEDAPSGGETLDAALRNWLDVPTAMVQLVVKIYELDATNDGTIGLDYMAWKNGPGRNLFVAGAFSEYASFEDAGTATLEPLGTGASGVPRGNFESSGYNYAYRYEVDSSFFDYLQVKGKAKTLNQTRMAILNTYTGSVLAGDQILYYNVQTGNPSGVRGTGDIFAANQDRFVVGTTTTTNDEGELEVLQTGLAVEITPTISEQSIAMNIGVSWSDYFGFTSSGFPEVNTRELSTRIITGLGDEICIGGLNRQVELTNVEKMPILGSLPIIGYAMGGETTQNRNIETVVTVKPVGVMKYELAQDYKVDDGSQDVIEKARKDKRIDLPGDSWGFDQYGIDPDRNVKPEAAK